MEGQPNASIVDGQVQVAEAETLGKHSGELRERTVAEHADIVAVTVVDMTLAEADTAFAEAVGRFVNCRSIDFVGSKGTERGQQPEVEVDTAEGTTCSHSLVEWELRIRMPGTAGVVVGRGCIADIAVAVALAYDELRRLADRPEFGRTSLQPATTCSASPPTSLQTISSWTSTGHIVRVGLRCLVLFSSAFRCSLPPTA